MVSWQKSEYPGVVQLIERVVWDHEAASLSLATRTKTPLKSLISEGFFLFFVYCGADCIVSEALIYTPRHSHNYYSYTEFVGCQLSAKMIPKVVDKII